MKTKGITREEWLSALGEADIKEDPSAFTIEELAKMLGIGRQAMNIRIRKLLSEGKADKARKRIRRSDGSLALVTAYKLL